MKFRFLLTWAISLLCLSCANEVDSLLEVDPSPGGFAALSVSVSNQVISKTRVESVYMPEGAELGLFLRASDGSAYDGVSVNNVKVKAEGIDESQSWAIDAENPIYLSSTVGEAYAYYPWQSAELVNPLIPITNDGTDWMYGESPASGLSVNNTTAQFTMVHAMAIIRCRLVKGNYYDPGMVTALQVSSEGLAAGANMDLAQARLVDFTDAGVPIAASSLGALGESPIDVELWAVPTGTKGTLTFQIGVDGNVYQAMTEDLTVAGGRIYDYTLTLNSNVLTVSTVSISAWNEESKGDSSPSVLDTWDIARRTDGVYAIDQYGDPVPYAEATGSTYAGAVFVFKGRAYQVAKENGVNASGSQTVYFWKSDYYDLYDVRNYLTSDGENWHAYLNGTSTPAISRNPADWQAGGISDMSGASNTDAFVRAQTVDGVPLEDTISQVVVNYRENAVVNGGYTDWFLPTCGHLAFMYLNFDAINDILIKSGCSALTKGLYWSCTQARSYANWNLNFSSGLVNYYYTYNTAYCRLIREI